MAEVRKKCWPEFFEMIASGRKKADIRVADFEVREGDVLVLEEWDPKTGSYTGRKISKNVGSVIKVDVSKMNSVEDITRNGLYLIEMV